MAIISFSRQVAAWGDEVAASLAEKLNYKFVKRTDIEKQIVELGFPKEKIPTYDERKPGFFASFASVRDEYLNYVQYALLSAAKDNNAVIIGRGAFSIFEKMENHVAVRLVADENTRIERLKTEFNWNEKQAKQRINESDVNRDGFHKNFFNVDVKDSSNYHMILNTGKMNVDFAAELVAHYVKANISQEDEIKGHKKIQEYLKAQTLVNKLVFEEKIDIKFIHAEINDNELILQGVTESPMLIDKAVRFASELYPEFSVKSVISVVQDFKTY